MGVSPLSNLPLEGKVAAQLADEVSFCFLQLHLISRLRRQLPLKGEANYLSL